MAEALSQNQIDELLNKMRTGTVEAVAEEVDTVKKYDFTSPRKFTKDQLKALNTLYENYARVLAVYLTGISGEVCNVEVTSIEEQRYYEFNNAIPDSTLVAMISFQPKIKDALGSTMIMQLQSSYGYALIDRLLGGSGISMGMEREYTEIELSLLSFVLTNVVNYIEESWSNFFPLEVSIQSIEVNGRLLQAYSPQDTVVISTLEVKDSITEVPINFCMPATNLEDIIESFGNKYTTATRQLGTKKEEVRKGLIMEHVSRSELTVEAILDECTMNFNDITHLQPGDIIALNTKITNDINIKIEGIDWCTARIGQLDENKAIKIVDVLQ